jgi:RNA polymerase sigma factor (sigma-70 family)
MFGMAYSQQMSKDDESYTQRLSREIDAANEVYKPGDPESEGRLHHAFRVQARNVASYHDVSRFEPSLANDIASRAMLALPKFRGRSRLSSWFYRIAQNEMKRALRGLIQKRKRDVSIDLDPEEDHAALLELEAKPTNQEAKIEFERLQQSLPPEQAEVLALQLEGNTLGEIAEKIETPLGTVRSRNRLAKAKARHSTKKKKRR